MNKHEALQVFKILKVSYPNFYKNLRPDEVEEIIDIWAAMFLDEGFHVVVQAVKSCVSVNKFPPSIAEIIEKVNLIKGKNKDDDSGLSAWNQIAKAISDANYNAKKYFDDFDDKVKLLVGSPQQLRQWALMDTNSLEVAKSHFLKSYKTIRQKELDFDKLPNSAKKLSEELKDDGLKLKGGNIQGKINE